MNAPYWFPVLTLISGLAGGYLADYMRDGRAAKRDRATARDDFQRETLIELQDWLAKLARATGRLHYLDIMEHHESGKWGRHQVPEGDSTALHEAIVNVNRYRTRILDEAIRQASKEFVAKCVDASIGAGHGDDDEAVRSSAVQAFHEMAPMNERLGDMIGTRLRDLS